MTLDQLEAVVSIVDHGSFRSAAEILNRSQPALSAAVKSLEDEFDLQIFDRGTYRPTLTSAGAAFVNVARSTLSASNYASRVARELGTKKAETKLRVSVDPLISSEIIEVLALECSRPVYPVTLVIEKSILNSSFEKLLAGDVDLALAPCASDDDRIESILLESVVMIGAVSRKLLQEKRKPTAEFLRESAQVFAYDLTPDEEPSQASSNSKALTNRRIFVPDHATKVNLIANGIGWGRISTKEFKSADDLVAIDKTLLSHVNLDLCLLRSRKKPLGPIARSIWSTFESRTKR